MTPSTTLQYTLTYFFHTLTYLGHFCLFYFLFYFYDIAVIKISPRRGLRHAATALAVWRHPSPRLCNRPNISCPLKASTTLHKRLSCSSQFEIMMHRKTEHFAHVAVQPVELCMLVLSPATRSGIGLNHDIPLSTISCTDAWNIIILSANLIRGFPTFSRLFLFSWCFL